MAFRNSIVPLHKLEAHTHTHRSPQERVQSTKPTRNVKTRLKYIELINRTTFKYAGHRTAVLVR